MKGFDEIRSGLPEPELTEIERGYKIENLTVEGREPALVFIHGGGGNLWNFFCQLEYFKDRFGLLSYNLSGYGKSDYRKDQGIQDHVEDLRKLLEEQGIERVVLHGHSYGFLIAMEYAKKYDPEGLIASGGAAYKFKPSWEKPLIDLFISLSLYRLQIPKKIKETVLKSILKVDSSELTIKDIIEGFQIPERRSAWETIRKSFWNYDPGNMGQVDCPTLLIHGKKDKIVAEDGVKRTIREIPKAELVKIDQCSHFSMVEDPNRYNGLVEKFLEQKII